MADNPFPDSVVKSVSVLSFLFSMNFTVSGFSSPYAIIALAKGCSLFFSSIYAKPISSFSSVPATGIISVTFGSPFVIVPVLSNATICTLPVSSNDAAVLNIIPFFAPAPFPTIIATGV